MLSSTLYLLILVSLIFFTNCYVYNGFDSLQIVDNQTSCVYTVTAKVDMLTENLNFYIAKAENCPPKQVGLVSFFNGDKINDSYMDYNTSGGISAIFPHSNLADPEINDSVCQLLVQYKVPDDVHLCAFAVDNLKFYVEVYSNRNNVFPPPVYTNTMIPDFTGNITRGYIMESKPNMTITPPAVSTSCIFYADNTTRTAGTTVSTSASAGGTKNAPCQTGQVYLQATEKMLGFLDGLSIKYALVQNSTMTNVIPLISRFHNWNFSAQKSCVALDITFMQLVQNNLTTCQNGCALSFILSNSMNLVYTLETRGFSTEDMSSAMLGHVFGAGLFKKNNGKSNSSDDTTVLALIIVTPIVFFLLLILGCILCWLRFKSAHQRAMARPIPAAQVAPEGSPAVRGQFPGPTVLVTGKDGVEHEVQLYPIIRENGVYMCQICRNRPANDQNSPCPHLLCCEDCSQRQNICPVCRAVNQNIGNQRLTRAQTPTNMASLPSYQPVITRSESNEVILPQRREASPNKLSKEP